MSYFSHDVIFFGDEAGNEFNFRPIAIIFSKQLLYQVQEWIMQHIHIFLYVFVLCYERKNALSLNMHFRMDEYFFCIVLLKWWENSLKESALWTIWITLYLHYSFYQEHSLSGESIHYGIVCQCNRLHC